MEKISEKDLYVFVFCPEKLADSKFAEISDNRDTFSSQLDQLLKMKEYLASFDLEDTPLKLFQKIKEIEKGSDILQKKMLSGKPMDYFVYKSKPRNKSKKALS